MNIYKKTRGFTLVEVLMAVSAMVILSLAMSSMYDPVKEKRENVRLNAYYIENAFSIARASAVSSAPVDISGVATVPDSGYGVYFKQINGASEMVVFADTNEVVDASCVTGNSDFFYTTDSSCGEDYVISTYSFDDDVLNSFLLDSTVSTIDDEFSLFFTSGSGNMRIFGRSASTVSEYKVLKVSTTIDYDSLNFVKDITCKKMEGFCDISIQ